MATKKRKRTSPTPPIVLGHCLPGDWVFVSNKLVRVSLHCDSVTFIHVPGVPYSFAPLKSKTVLDGIDELMMRPAKGRGRKKTPVDPRELDPLLAKPGRY